ncbi:glycosyltransferase family 39 protein [Stappia sp. F7233]|uniref:Glycosyltransferase family 39 protein n=1 Tax=Stappia albiluteola TaxID=2758565 RepID=A0A839ABP8_9HYPH|nr:glycosyltransferase family 39 protein [Stappia albiluteola]MBA5776424.1 glycosyltransferase family 39 protein [Stappia albiluteola]
MSGSVPSSAIAENSAGLRTEPDRRPLWLRIAGRRLLAPVILLALALAMIVPGVFQVPPLDRDEPRFAQATKQMVESGDYVDIRFQDEPRHKKPVGIYWLQSAAVAASGKGADAPIWVYRLPSQVGAVLAVILTYWAARAFLPPSAALLAGLFTALAIILGVEARLAKTDAVLLACIVASQGALARLWLKAQEINLPRGRPWPILFLFWTSLSASILIKGPVGLMVVGLTIAALSAATRKLGWIRTLAPLPGILYLLLLVSPWFVAIWIATDGQFFQEAVGKDFVGKLATGQESHGAPPLTHLAAMLGTFWPLPGFLLLAFTQLKGRLMSPPVLFALCWALPSWVVFELVATKLPHYTLPILPALAILAAALVGAETRRPAGKALRWAASVLYFVPAAVLAAAAIAAPVHLGIWPSPPGAVIALLSLVFSLAAVRYLLRDKPLAATGPAILASLLIAAGTWGFTMPSLSPIWISPRLAETVRQTAGCTDPEVATAGFSEPSYVFLQGTGTLLSTAEGAATFLAEAAPADCRVAVIDMRQEPRFKEEASAAGLGLREAARVQGLNINGGRKLDIGVYLKEGTGRD